MTQLSYQKSRKDCWRIVFFVDKTNTEFLRFDFAQMLVQNTRVQVIYLKAILYNSKHPRESMSP